MIDWSAYKLPKLATNALERAKLRPDQVSRMTDAELLAVHSVGAVMLQIIRKEVPYQADLPSLHDEQTVVNGKSIAQWRAIWRQVVKAPRPAERAALSAFADTVDRALAKLA